VTIVATLWGAARMGGRCPAEEVCSESAAGLRIPHSAVAMVSGRKYCTCSSNLVSSSAESSVRSAVERNIART